MNHATAKVSCFARAYHTLHHPAPVFADRAAKALLGEAYDQIAEHMKQGIGYFLPGFTGTEEEGLRLIADGQLGPSVLGRSAFCERMLLNERRLGCRQYLILASGFDTFAVTDEDPALSVYELDLPELLEEKKARIRSAGLSSRAVFVPCDLAQPKWTEKLTESGYRPCLKTFASLLGISYYLEPAAWETLLRSLAGIMPEGSAVCFDYPSHDRSGETERRRELAREAGERMKAVYSYQETESMLSGCGFLIYEHLGPEEMTEQYFAEHNLKEPEHPMSAPAGVSYVLAVRKG